MMPEGYLVAARGLRGVMQRPSAHTGAKGAGVALFAYVKDHLREMSPLDDILNVELPAKLLNGAVVAVDPAEPRVKGDSHKLKMLGVKFAEHRHARKQADGILAAGNADGYPVALAYHIILLASRAHIAQKFLHGFILLL